LLDPERKAARDRLTVTGIALLLAGVLGCVAVSPFIPRFQAWPFLVPLALGVAGLIGVILAASLTPLSDAGLIESARWRGFKRYLKSLATSDADSAAAVPSRWIVYAVSSGLGYYWWRYLKRHPGVRPPRWFIASGGDDGAAFATFVGSHGGGGGAGGAGGGAAAGGGASGAA
jgi:hypothetical protein